MAMPFSGKARVGARLRWVLAFEIRIADRAAILPIEGEQLTAILVTVKAASNPLVKMIAPPVRYWFHPEDQTVLLRIDHGDSTLTLIGAT